MVWWRGAALYEAYPATFADGDGDGTGDLAGLTSRLGYLADLGVDAVWLTPIYPSGGVDGGYDVTDYRDVDPVYGGLEAFDRFLAEAHRIGLRVVLDFVPNHTSSRHPWFLDSRSSRRSARRRWYVWADGRPGDRAGRVGPPNNWLSTFGGSAWVFDPPTGQFYLASYYPEQADLDWDNPEVREAMTEALRFWVDRGVDGFRLDVVHRLSKDPELRDDPLLPGRDPAEGWGAYDHLYDLHGPRIHDHVRAIRRAVGPTTLLLGEINLFDLEKVFSYLAPGELDLAFNFPFAMGPWDAESKAEAVAMAEALAIRGPWPCYHLSNHDEVRHPTRFGERTTRAAAVLLLTLRGTPVLWQGEELGMTNVAVPPDRRRDRKGRDGARTPMRWDASPGAGFCPPGVEPYLPIGPGHRERNVRSESADPDSVLALYRRLLALRRRSPAIRSGTHRRIEAGPRLMAFLREARALRHLVVVNLSSEPAAFGLGGGGTVEVATSARLEGRRIEGTCRLEGDQAVVILLDRGTEV
jgi:alpha-glucosidase